MVVDIFFPMQLLTYLFLQMSLEIGNGWGNLIKFIDVCKISVIVQRGFGEEIGMEMDGMEWRLVWASFLSKIIHDLPCHHSLRYKKCFLMYG